MTRRTFRLGVIALSATLLVGCSSPPPPAPEPTPEATASKPETPSALIPGVSINAMMVDLIDHAGHNLWNVERPGMAPKSDADWENVTEHAVQLAAAASAITAGGTGPTDAIWVGTPAWRSQAQKMADAATEAIAAATGKQLDALVTANGKLVESCEGCHKEFKPDLPSEGISHKHID